MSYFVSKIGHLDPRFYSLIYCDTGGSDVGGPDVGGPDVGGPDVRFPFRSTVHSQERVVARSRIRIIFRLPATTS